jgi:putative membrane protein
MSKTGSHLNWQRTSPVAMLYSLLNGARQFVTNGLPAVAVGVAAYASGGATRRSWVLTGFLIVSLISMVGSILGWLRFRFCIVDDRVLVRSGVLHREELSVEFGRIQNISIREPVYMRPFGLAVLSIDTAGSGQKEIILGGIKKDTAIELRETILSKAQPKSAGSAAESVADTGALADKSLLLSRSTKDIVIYGLTVNFLFWVLVAAGAFFGAQGAAENFFTWLGTKIQFQDLVAAFDSAGGLFGSIVILIATIFVIFLLLPLISVLGALVRHYGYRLSVEGETYRKNSGLLTRHDESLKRHKIQAMVLRQNFVARFFKRTNMQLRIASAGSGAESGQLPTGPKTTFLVPVLHQFELDELVPEFFPACEFDDVQFSNINRRRFSMVILGLAVLPPAILVTVLLSLIVSWKFVVLLPIVVTLAWLIVSRFWKKIGYGVVADYGFVRRGFFGTQTTVFPLFKVQRIDIRQTPGQRRKGLAYLAIHLASHTLKIPYVRVQDAEKFRDLALYHVESSNRAWY